MQLNPRACEYYRLAITATPPVTSAAWELSVDGGATWTAATVVDGLPAWLVRGPDYAGDQTDTALLVSATVRPILRLIDDPETIVRTSPSIHIT